MSKIVGKPKYLLLEKVKQELLSLSKQRRGLLLDLLDKKSELVKTPEGLRHTDQMLLELSRENRWPVLTVVAGVPVFERNDSTGPKGRCIVEPGQTGTPLVMTPWN